MKPILYIEARKKFTDLNLDVLDKLLGKTISLAATVQYLPILYTIKKHLETKGKKVIIKKGPAYPGHVIGCNSSTFSTQADTLLLLADGKFHALNNAIQLNKEIYVFNIYTLEKLTNEEIKKANMKKQAAIKKFLALDTIGILVSTKLGQNFNIGKLKQKIQDKGKKVYIFESNNINTNELENFPIKIWVNTACPGLSLDSSKIINYQDILQYIK